MRTVTFYVDGGMLGRTNPCPEGIRWSVWCSPPSKVVLRAWSSRYHTNNEAEWLAVRAALLYACKHHIKRIQIYSDSRLIVNQFNGVWRTKDVRMWHFRFECCALAHTLSECSVSWRPRQYMVNRLGH